MSARELTAAAPGAVRVLELVGEDARALLAARFERPLPDVGGVVAGRLLDADGSSLDEALVVARPDGALELHLHGSPAVVARASALFGAGVPAVTGGDAPRRASLAELLAGTRTEAAARVLLDQLEGAFARALEVLVAAPTDEALDALVARAAWGHDLIVPRRVVLAGPTNAGKSTLFNALVGTERALTSDVAGTTRDALDAVVELAGFPVELVDTAGWRAVGASAAERVERAGQERGRALAQEADLVLWATCEAVGEAPRTAAPGSPAPAGPGLEDARALGAVRTVVLGLQADRVEHPTDRAAVSALADPAGAAARVTALVREAFGWPAEPWVPGRAVPWTREQAARLTSAREARGKERASILRALFDESVAPG